MQLCGTEESTSVLAEPAPGEDDTRFGEEELTGVGVDTQLKHNLASLFLKMRRILNISESALQEIIQRIGQVFKFSEPLIFSVVLEILRRHYPDIDNAVVKEVVCSDRHKCIFETHNSWRYTFNRRETYIVNKFPVVKPVEFVTDKQGQHVVYVPLIKMLQALLRKDDVFDKALTSSSSIENEYSNKRAHFN